MRTNRFFWGLIIVVLGVLLLLQTMGFLAWNAWAYFWPFFLILAGLWIFLRPAVTRGQMGGQMESTSLAIPQENAVDAYIEFHHGAGTLAVGSLAAVGNILDGTFGGGVVHSLDRYGTTARVKLRAEAQRLWWNWGPGDGFRWNVHLSNSMPMDLAFHTGAGEGVIDLRDVQVRKLVLETGASSTRLTLPARAGQTSVEVHAGAASVVLMVPQGVAGRIRVQSGLIGLKIDQNRFPHNGYAYEFPDFVNAENKVEISIEAGVGSIEVVSA